MRAFWPAATVITAFALALAAVRYPGARTVLLGLAVWTALGAFVAAGWALGRRREWAGFSDTAAPDPETGRYRKAAPVVHETPHYLAVPQVTPCCDLPVLALPSGEHISSEPGEVTCRPGGDPGGPDVP